MIARHLLEDLLRRAHYRLREDCACHLCAELCAEIEAVHAMSAEKLDWEPMLLPEPD